MARPRLPSPAGIIAFLFWTVHVPFSCFLLGKKKRENGGAMDHHRCITIRPARRPEKSPFFRGKTQGGPHCIRIIYKAKNHGKKPATAATAGHPSPRKYGPRAARRRRRRRGGSIFLQVDDHYVTLMDFPHKPKNAAVTGATARQSEGRQKRELVIRVPRAPFREAESGEIWRQ